MTRFHVKKKLPPRWVYIPTKRQLRDLIEDVDADVRVVEFDGIVSVPGKRPDNPYQCLGVVEGRVVDSAWCFFVRLWGIREVTVGTHISTLPELALADIRRFMKSCLRKKPDPMVKPRQMRLSFNINSESVRSTGAAEDCDRWSANTGGWWEKNSED